MPVKSVNKFVNINIRNRSISFNQQPISATNICCTFTCPIGNFLHFIADRMCCQPIYGA